MLRLARRIEAVIEAAELACRDLEPTAPTLAEVFFTDAAERIFATLPTWAQAEVLERSDLGGRLEDEIAFLIRRAASGEYTGPLVFPAAVCEAYRDEPKAGSYHDCERCGFPVPLVPGSARRTEDGRTETAPARRLFPECPVCGGLTGHLAHFHWLRWIGRRLEAAG